VINPGRIDGERAAGRDGAGVTVKRPPGQRAGRAAPAGDDAITPAGPAYLLIATDVQLNVAEGNEGNNVAAVAFTIQ
jgi:hypothetical protein